MKNPPAFPTNQYANGISPSGFDTGMTLRDYFAAKAMQVILQSQYEDGIYVGDKDNIAEQVCANSAYIMADAMLAAKETIK